MSRDWQKDMMECEMMRTRVTSFLPEIGIYWLQQYKELQEECDEWKTLAESLNGDIRIANEELAKINCDYYADKQRFHDRGRELEETKESNRLLNRIYDEQCARVSEYYNEMVAEKERADKLQEVINQAIKEYGLWNDKAHAADVMATLLAEARLSLYPKEETK